MRRLLSGCCIWSYGGGDNRSQLLSSLDAGVIQVDRWTGASWGQLRLVHGSHCSISTGVSRDAGGDGRPVLGCVDVEGFPGDSGDDLQAPAAS